MRSVTAVVSCPVCGASDWEESTQMVNPLRGVLAAECVAGHAFAVCVEVVGVRWSEGCGTTAGYKRHLRAGEDACAACKRAQSALRGEQKRRAKARAAS